jgi:hypothetical protein
MPKREFVLVSLGRREFAKRRGKFITTKIEGARPTDLPAGFTNWRDGWSWAEVTEVIGDPKHSGAPTYAFEDWQVGRIRKIIASQQKEIA